MSPDSKKAQDESIFRQLTAMPEFINADMVLTYVSTDIEADTRRIIEHSLSTGKTVAVPRCQGENMVFHIITSFSQLHSGLHSILEPDMSLPAVEVFDRCVCIVPGLCFDSSGYRLGYGGGFYDRFLSWAGCFSVGLCYEEFLMDFPVQPFDVPVDMVVTPRRIYGSGS